MDSQNPQKEQEITKQDKAKLYKIRKTLLKMLSDRGYAISQKEMSIPFNEWEETCTDKRTALTYFATKKEDSSDNIFVEYYGSEPLNFDQIVYFNKKLIEKNIKAGIIITEDPPTSSVRTRMQKMTEFVDIEFFEEKELIINITEHELVPKHILLTPEEKKMLLEKYRVDESQLPKILITDPVAKYLGLKRGQVVKIIRASETAGRYITYRIAQ